MKKIVVTSENAAGFLQLPQVPLDYKTPFAPSDAAKDDPGWLPDHPIRAASRPESHGVAELEQLENAGFLSPDPTFPGVTIVCQHNRRVVAVEKGLTLGHEVRSTHCLVVSKTGGGKTSRFILPVILSDLKAGHNVVFSDAKGDLVGAVHGFVKEHCPDAKFLCLDFTRPDISTGWNPFEAGVEDTAATELFEALLPPAGLHETHHFRDMGVRLASAIARGLAAVLNDPVTLPRIGMVLRAGHETVGKLAHASGQSELRFFAQQSGQSNADTTYDGLMNSMTEFVREDVATVTSTGELDFDDFDGDQQVVLALRFPEGVRRTKGVQSMFVTSLLAWIVGSAGRSASGALNRHLSLIFDEFASALDRLPSLERAIHTLRARNVSLTAAVQSLSQFRTVYGSDAESILAGFNTYAFLSPVDFQDAEYASRLSGEMMVEEFSVQGPAQIVTGRQCFARRVFNLLDIAVPARHPEYGNLMTFICRGNLVFQAALPPIWRYPGYESWDRARGGQLPSGDLPTRKRPLKPPTTNFFARFGAKEAMGLSSQRGMTTPQVRDRLQSTEKKIDVAKATPFAQQYWAAIKQRNEERPASVLRLAEEIARRGATLSEFHAAYMCSGTEHLPAVLHYLDYVLAKQAKEAKDKEEQPDLLRVTYGSPGNVRSREVVLKNRRILEGCKESTDPSET